MRHLGDPDSPALTVTALTNCSLQLLLPTTRARFVFLISLSTVLCGRAQERQKKREIKHKKQRKKHKKNTTALREWKLLRRCAWQSVSATAHMRPGTLICWNRAQLTVPLLPLWSAVSHQRRCERAQNPMIPQEKKKGSVPALHQRRIHGSATIMRTEPSVSLRHHLADQRWELTQISTCIFLFFQVRFQNDYDAKQLENALPGLTGALSRWSH